MLATLTLNFLDKGFDQLDKNAINFSSWKLDDLKMFLKLIVFLKKMSKWKESEILLKVINVWRRISREVKFSDKDVLDSDIPTSFATTNALDHPH